MSKRLKLDYSDSMIAPILDINIDSKNGQELSKKELKNILGLDEIMFVEVGWTKIFQAGKWKGDNYTREDMLEMVNNFHILGETYQPAIKVSHPQGKRMMDDEMKERAYGWVSKVKEESGQLFAKFEFPIEFYKENIAGKSLRYKSCEVRKVKYDGVIYNNVISAVALLGISMPGCGRLGEIEDENSSFRLYDNELDGSKRVFEFDTEEEGNLEMKPNTEDLNKDAKALDNEKPDVKAEGQEDAKADDKQDEASKPEDKEEAKDEESAPKSDDKEEDAKEEDAKPEEKAPESKPESKPEENKEAPEDKDFTLKENTLRNEFTLQLEAMEAKFMKQYDAQNAIIAQFESDHTKNEITNDVETLVRDGHLKPADKELCTAIFHSMKSADKVEFSISDEIVEDPCKLFKHLLKSYTAWESDASNKSDDNIDKDVKSADPIEPAPVQKMYSGKNFTLDNADTAQAAKELQKKYAAEGKEVDYMVCWKEVKSNK